MLKLKYWWEDSTLYFRSWIKYLFFPGLILTLSLSILITQYFFELSYNPWYNKFGYIIDSSKCEILSSNTTPIISATNITKTPSTIITTIPSTTIIVTPSTIISTTPTTTYVYTGYLTINLDNSDDIVYTNPNFWCGTDCCLNFVTNHTKLFLKFSDNKLIYYSPIPEESSMLGYVMFSLYLPGILILSGIFILSIHRKIRKLMFKRFDHQLSRRELIIYEDS